MAIPFQFKNVRLDGGGYFQRILPHPTVANVVVAGCDVAGFYLWNEATTSWSLIGDFKYADRNYWGAASFAWHPTDSNTFWMACGKYTSGSNSLPGAVFKSTNRGQTLTKLNFPSIPFGSNQNQRRIAGERLTVCPNNPDVLLFGVYYSSTSEGKGIYRSTDAGITWTQLDHSVIAPSQTVPAINLDNGVVFTCWDNQISGLCYCGVFGLGISQSTDYGITWTFIGGPDYPMRGKSINGTLYVTSMTSDSDLTTSTNSYKTFAKYTNGSGWTNLATGTFPQGNPCSTLDINPFDPNDIIVTHPYLKYYVRSLDAGITWTKYVISSYCDSVPYQEHTLPAAEFGEGIADIKFDPIIYGRVWASNFYYIIKTDNIHATNSMWISYGIGIENTVPISLLIPKGSNDTLLSGLFDIEGFKHSRGYTVVPINKYGGNSALDLTIYRTLNCYSLSQCINNPLNILKVNGNYTGASECKVLRSQDGGTTWSTVSATPSGTLRVSYSSTDSLTWIVLPKGAPPSYTVNGGSSFTSLNTLPNWLNYVFNYSQPLVADPSNGNVWYYLDDNVSNSSTYGNLYKLTKSGSVISGSLVSASKLPRTFDGTKTSQLCVDSIGTIYGSFFELGLWKSSDGGVNFTQLTNVQEALAVCVGAPDVGFSIQTIYIFGKCNSNTEYGVWMSQDAGVTWQLVSSPNNNGHGLQSDITCLATSQDTFGVVMVGTDGHGIFQGLANPPSPPSIPTGNFLINFTKNTSLDVYPGASLDLVADKGVDNPSAIGSWTGNVVVARQSGSVNKPAVTSVLAKKAVTFNRDNQQYLVCDSFRASWQAIYIIFKLNTATFDNYDGIFLYRDGGYTGNVSDEQYCINGIPGTRNITDGLTANPDLVATEAWLNGVAIDVNNLHDDGLGVPINSGWNILAIHKPGNVNTKVPYIGIDPVFSEFRAASISIGRILAYEQFNNNQKAAIEDWANNYYSTSIKLYSDTVLADLPAFYYKLNTTTGTEASLGTSSAVLTYNSNVNRGVAGLVVNEDKAANFNGTTGTNAIFSNSSISGKIDITVECIIKLNTLNTSGAFIKLGNNSSGIGIGVGNGNFDSLGNILVAIAESVAWVNTGYSLGTSKHHIAMTVNATTNSFTVYIDGIQQYQQTTNWIGMSESTVCIGGYSYAGLNRYANSVIDEVAIYLGILSPTKISQHAALI